MSPRLMLLSMIPVLALSPALSRAEGPPPSPFPDAEIRERLQQMEQYARQAGEELIRSLQLIESAIPRYGVPYVDESGNIVIPRRKSPAPTPPSPSSTDRT
jgi:hypothetical protein